MSYRLHAELAAEHDGAKRWGFRQVYCGSLAANGRSIGKEGRNGWSKLPKIGNGHTKRKGVKVPDALDWFAPETITSYSQMGTPETTAQVHPYLFTTSMASLAEEKGVQIILGSVSSIDRTSGSINSITYASKETKEQVTITDVTDVIVTAGPWTQHVLPEAPISATRAHSVTIKADVSNYAIFSDIDLPSGQNVSPEMYARPDGSVYACGEGDTLIPLPTTSDLVQCDEHKCQEIIDYCGSISDHMRDGEVLVKQACYLPSVSFGGGPMIGRTKTEGLWVAAGHTCWGIQNSCATGKVMSEFLFEGKAKSANVASLDPRKWM